MTQDVLIETRGKNIVVAMPGTSYRIRYRPPNSDLAACRVSVTERR
jgi:hypothetical protein